METDLLTDMRHAPSVPLAPPTLESTSIAAALECVLRSSIAAYRREDASARSRIQHAAAHSTAASSVRTVHSDGGAAGRSHAAAGGLAVPFSDECATPWNASLESVLMMALFSYEQVCVPPAVALATANPLSTHALLHFERMTNAKCKV
ncbi:hypothetical protein EON66_09470, partial [archaeon]